MTNWNDWFCVLTVQVFVCFFDTVWAFLATHLRDLKAMATLYEGRGTTSNPKLKSHHWKNGGQSWPIPMNDHHWMHMFNPLWLLKSTILHGVYSEYPASWCWNSNFKWFPVIKKHEFSWVQSQSDHRKEVVPPGKSEFLIFKYVTFSVLTVT